ncbi:hypothetical protein GCM10023116_15700 [Kistimonas scapharcae]|uniref:BHLH domain-containing protein n=1 Tax=Kistimonas scapharcae TaxID=1036133 RepID=A0ABP8V224_9GAMM
MNHQSCGMSCFFSQKNHVTQEIGQPDMQTYTNHGYPWQSYSLSIYDLVNQYYQYMQMDRGSCNNLSQSSGITQYSVSEIGYHNHLTTGETAQWVCTDSINREALIKTEEQVEHQDKSDDAEDQPKETANKSLFPIAVSVMPRVTEGEGGLIRTFPKKKRVRKQTPVQRKAANVRERKRMNIFNKNFEGLRISLPDADDRKSRIQILNGAIAYMKDLMALLGREK